MHKVCFRRAWMVALLAALWIGVEGRTALAAESCSDLKNYLSTAQKADAAAQSVLTNTTSWKNTAAWVATAITAVEEVAGGQIGIAGQDVQTAYVADIKALLNALNRVQQQPNTLSTVNVARAAATDLDGLLKKNITLISRGMTANNCK